MPIPVRCFTCGKNIGMNMDRYNAHTEKDKSKILDEMGYTRYCCRRMFLTHTDIDRLMSHFYNTSHNPSSDK